MKSLEEVKEIAIIEKNRLDKLGLVVGGVGAEGKRLRTSMESSAGSKKTAKGDGTSVVLEVHGEEARTGSKKSAVNDISVVFILWGHSQKTQLAGVTALAHRETEDNVVLCTGHRVVPAESFFFCLGSRGRSTKRVSALSPVNWVVHSNSRERTQISTSSLDHAAGGPTNSKTSFRQARL